MPTVDYGNGLKVHWTKKEMEKIRMFRTNAAIRRLLDNRPDLMKDLSEKGQGFGENERREIQLILRQAEIQNNLEPEWEWMREQARKQKARMAKLRGEYKC